MGETPTEIKRMTAKRKAEIVMEIFQGKTSVSEVSRRYDLTPAQIEEWMGEARKGMENQLRARPKDIAAMYEEKIKEMKAVIGELTLENLALKKYDALDSGKRRSDAGAERNETRRASRQHRSAEPLVRYSKTDTLLPFQAKIS